MQPSELNMTTEVIGYQRLLFIRLPVDGVDSGLAGSIDRLGDGMWMSHTGLRLIVKYHMGTGEIMDRIQYDDDAPAPHGLTNWNGDLWSCDANWPAPVHPDGPSFSRIVR